ncbi:MAG: hypothetical protein B6I29_00090 [Marinitoga sp. 4572_148]|nr:MAG: hypothetical protein B6I29_00090 [Marinitoga sp. 4572_148]
MLSKKFFLILTIISFSILSFSEKLPIYRGEEFIGYLNTSLNDSTNKEIINGYWLNLTEIDKDLDYFILGTLNSYDLIYRFSKNLGSYLIEKGYNFIVFGNLKTLKKNSTNFFKYIASSPYIVSQVLYTMIRGFETSGIYPIIYLDNNYEKEVKTSLEQKVGKITFFSEIDSQNYLFYDTIEEKVYFNGKYLPKLYWKIPEENSIKNIISEIYRNSIIITGWLGNGYKVYYRQLPKNSKEKSIIYFSKDVENIINDFLKNNITIYSAKKNWNW